jgi:16S rRNA (uracil1498-N3)-methyltransferase
VVEPVRTLAALPVEGELLVAAIDGPADVVAQLDPSGAVTVVTGPEGGLDPTERAALTALGARDWCLGPFVLRAETAPLAAAIALLV